MNQAQAPVKPERKRKKTDTDERQQALSVSLPPKQEQASISKEVVNFYEKIKKEEEPDQNPNLSIHGIKIPFRVLIVGATGSMKTNCALDLVQKFSGTFFHITVVTRNKDEPLYNLLTKHIPEDQLTMIEIDEDDLDKLPDMKKMSNKSPPTLVIFDDLVLVEKPKKIVEYFIRGRKMNISMMYLTQSYFGSPKKLRGQCNIVILKKVQGNRDWGAILREYQIGIELSQLKQVYENCIDKDKKDFLMIKLDNPSSEQLFHNYDPIKESDIPPPEEKVKKKRTNKNEQVRKGNEEEEEEKESDHDDQDAHQPDRFYNEHAFHNFDRHY